MTKLIWDEHGKRIYETGVDRGILYLPALQGKHTTGVAWNGLTSGTEPRPQHTDNIKHLNLYSLYY